jgi:uncharacterized protein
MLNFEIVLRVHVHRANVASVISLAHFIRENFLNDGRFKILLERIKNFGAKKIALELLSNKELRAVQERVESAASDALMMQTSGVYCCYAAMPNHFVVRANGKIQKCTVALYDERNDVGELLPDGTIEWKQKERIIAWSDGLLRGDLERMSCPLKGIMEQASLPTRHHVA